MMSHDPHPHPLELLSALLDGALEAEERVRVEAHLQGCEACRGVLEDLRAISRAASAEAPPPVPADLAARIGWRLRSAPRAKRRRFVIPATAAATLAALALVGVVAYRERHVPGTFPREETPPAPRAVPAEPTPSVVEIPPPRPDNKGEERRQSVKAPAERPRAKAPPEAAPMPTEVLADERAAEPLSAARELASTEDLAPPPEAKGLAMTPSRSVASAAPECVRGFDLFGKPVTWTVADKAVALERIRRKSEELRGRVIIVATGETLSARLTVPAEELENLSTWLAEEGLSGSLPPRSDALVDCFAVEFRLRSEGP